MPMNEYDDIFVAIDSIDSEMENYEAGPDERSQTTEDPFQDENEDPSGQPGPSTLHNMQDPLNSPPNPITTDHFPLKTQIEGVIRTIDSLDDTTRFVTDVTGESYNRFKRSRFGQAISNLRSGCVRAHWLLVKATDGGSLYSRTKESDVIPDEDIFYRWTTDCNTFILGLQAVLEGKVRVYLDTMEESQPQIQVEHTDDWEVHDDFEDDEEEEEWTMLEKGENGSVHSHSLPPSKEEPSNSIPMGSTQQVFDVLNDETDDDLADYADQLGVLRHDLGLCINPQRPIPSHYRDRRRS